MFDTMINDWQSTRSFKTQANLEKHLAKCGLDKIGGKLLVVTPEGRFTCVFSKSFIDSMRFSIGFVIHQGYKVIG